MDTGDTKEVLKSETQGCRPMKVPTDDEVKALNALRSIKERVREIKKRFSDISSGLEAIDTREMQALKREMAGLKIEWNAWEKKKQDAVRERMILLGHEEP